jgi:hypothetical protein
MTTDFEAKCWRGVFREWILPLEEDGTTLGKNPVGPFTVEVWLDNRGKYSKWRARLIPTRLPMSNEGFNTAALCKYFVASHFRSQIEGWKEYDDAQIKPVPLRP